MGNYFKNLQLLASKLIQTDSDFVYNIIIAGGINLHSWLFRAKQAWSQSLLIIYVTQISPKLHLCGLFCISEPKQIMCQSSDGFKHITSVFDF